MKTPAQRRKGAFVVDHQLPIPAPGEERSQKMLGWEVQTPDTRRPHPDLQNPYLSLKNLCHYQELIQSSLLPQTPWQRSTLQ